MLGTMFGFISPIIANNQTSNRIIVKQQHNVKVNIVSVKATNNKENGSIKISVLNGVSPFKAIVYSTSHSNKEYNFTKDLSIENLPSGEYLIVISDQTNAFVSENITL